MISTCSTPLGAKQSRTRSCRSTQYRGVTFSHRRGSWIRGRTCRPEIGTQRPRCSWEVGVTERRTNIDKSMSQDLNSFIRPIQRTNHITSTLKPKHTKSAWPRANVLDGPHTQTSDIHRRKPGIEHHAIDTRPRTEGRVSSQSCTTSSDDHKSSIPAFADRFRLNTTITLLKGPNSRHRLQQIVHMTSEGERAADNDSHHSAVKNTKQATAVDPNPTYPPRRRRALQQWQNKCGPFP